LKTLITGVCGFVGQHLLKYLIDDRCSLGIDSSAAGRQDRHQIQEHLLGIDIKQSSADDINTFPGSSQLLLDALESASLQNKINFKFEYLQVDLTDSKKVDEIISFFKPDRIYHLAAQASVKHSWANPIETFQTNVFSGIYLLEALKKYCPDCKMLIACTAEEYGEVENGNAEAIREEYKINPSNPYAISKASLDFFATTYQKVNNLNIYISRSFNHTGPGQSENFVTSDFARQIAEIESGLRKPVVHVGNIDAYRDFLDVRDVVRAYECIIQLGRPGQAYNVCSGKKRKISEILDMLISYSTQKNISINVDAIKFRPIDIKVIYGNNSKLKEETGWESRIDINQSLADILNWWRERSIRN
jgi:GDP-4-dehydro-6-deoxy-D-mannose reductase